jgi:hypothetical protein
MAAQSSGIETGRRLNAATFRLEDVIFRKAKVRVEERSKTVGETANQCATEQTVYGTVDSIALVGITSKRCVSKPRNMQRAAAESYTYSMCQTR